MIGDLLFQFFVEVVLYGICYGAGAIVLVAVTAGRLKPGRENKEENLDRLIREGDYLYTLDGVRFLYSRWVILLGLLVWVVVLLGLFALKGVGVI